MDKGTIRVNKKRHSQAGYKRINPDKNGNENLTSTVYHEVLHFAHPNKSERNIRKMEKSGMKKMSEKMKHKFLAKLN